MSGTTRSSPNGSSPTPSSSSSSGGKLLGRTVATELNVHKFNQASTGIAGTSTNIHNSYKELEAELKADIAGQKEYTELQRRSNVRKAELRKRIAENKEWIAGFEKGEDGAFEAQYKRLLEDIEVIYANAKEFHGKGIDMLIEQFKYHLAFKRWNDTFTAVPFKPK